MTAENNAAPRPRILIVDDNEQYTRQLSAYLCDEHRCDVAHTVEEGIERCMAISYDVVLLDLDFGPGCMDGFDFMESCVAALFETPVVVVTRFREMEKIKRAILLGAFHYFIKEDSLEDLADILVRALADRRLKRKSAVTVEEASVVTDEKILRASPNFVKIMESARKVADTRAPVLLTGETGTGKSMLARWIHHLSRRKGAFVEINAAAIPETLVEATLFGTERGIYTGAIDRRGVFEAADGGTLFLDEIGDVNPGMQLSLLKAIDEQWVARMGNQREIHVDVRVITATSRNLAGMMERGEFRPELFQRINTFPLHVPPLRERPEDFELLVNAFREQAARRNNRPVAGITSSALQYLMLHDWPGNVRELANRIEAAVIQRGEGFLRAGDFPAFTHHDDEEFDWKLIKAGVENAARQQLLLRLFDKTGGNKTEMAELAGVSRKAIHEWINQLGLENQMSG